MKLAQELHIETPATESHEAPHHIEAAPMSEKFSDTAEKSSEPAQMHAGVRKRSAKPNTAAQPCRRVRSREQKRLAKRRDRRQPMREDRRDYRRPEVNRPRVETRPPQVAPSSANGERRTLNLTKTGSHPAAHSH